MSPRRHRVEGALLVVVSACTFATLPILVKLGLRAGLDVEQMLTIRFVIAGVGMAVIAGIAEGRFRALRWRQTRLAVLAGGLFTVQALALFLALEEVPAAFASLVLFVYPIIVVVIGAVLLGRRATLQQVVGLGLSVAGVALLVGGISVSATWALAAAFAAPILYAVYLLVSERISADIPPLTVSAIVLLTGAAIMLALAAMAHGIAPAIDAEGWAVVAGLALVPMLAVPTLVAGLARLGATPAAIVSTVEPAVTVALAAIILGEAIGTGQLIGGALVLTAVILVQMERSSPRLASSDAPDDVQLAAAREMH